ncbi:cof-like hydrolase [Lachnospiraceae bacterium 2_1_46FAA]|nr:cof-like hydrolase [Lachnospiraceae bacterium 2_1_46FAA]
MGKQIKMIGLDCDGTLLNNNKELTDHSREVLCRAIERGIVIVVATGRPLTGIPKEVLDIDGIRYALTSNGARIVDIKENRIISKCTMSTEKTKELLQLFSAYDTYKEIFIDGQGYTNRSDLENIENYAESESMARYARSCRKPVENMEELLEDKEVRVDKVHVMFSGLKEREQAFEEVKTVQGVTATSAISNNIEVNMFGVNKGEGLLRLGTLLGIERDEIMACGDGMNDFEMLKAVGFGVAMENAVEKVKQAADYVTDTNENDGVAKAIEKFALA